MWLLMWMSVCCFALLLCRRNTVTTAFTGATVMVDARGRGNQKYASFVSMDIPCIQEIALP
jgi:hypothetical protein